MTKTYKDALLSNIARSNKRNENRLVLLNMLQYDNAFCEYFMSFFYMDDLINLSMVDWLAYYGTLGSSVYQKILAIEQKLENDGINKSKLKLNSINVFRNTNILRTIKSFLKYSLRTYQLPELKRSMEEQIAYVMTKQNATMFVPRDEITLGWSLSFSWTEFEPREKNYENEDEYKSILKAEEYCPSILS